MRPYIVEVTVTLMVLTSRGEAGALDVAEETIRDHLEQSSVIDVNPIHAEEQR